MIRIVVLLSGSLPTQIQLERAPFVPRGRPTFSLASTTFHLMRKIRRIIVAYIVLQKKGPKLASGWLACLYREGVEPSGSL
jgi:hypothetical protein